MSVVVCCCLVEPYTAENGEQPITRAFCRFTSKIGPRAGQGIELWWQAYSPRKASSSDRIGSNAQTGLSTHG